MTLLKQIILSLSILIAFLTVSCGNDSSSISINNWEILYTQDQSLNTVLRKSGWEPIASPSVVKLPYQLKKDSQNDFQYVWLRGNFELGNDPSSRYGLSTGRIRFTDRIFINNYFIGSLPPEKVNWTPMPRNYLIPEGILKTGNNVVHIKLGVFGDVSGGISDGIFIQEKEEFDRASLINNLIYNLIPFGIIFLYLGLVLEYLVSYFWDKKEKQYLYFSLSLIIAIIYVSMFLPSCMVVSFELSSVIKFSSPVIIFIFIMLLIQSIYRIYLTNLNRAIIALLISIVISYIVITFKLRSPLIMLIFSVVTFPVIVFAFTYLIIRLNSIHRSRSKNPDKFLRYISILILSMFSLLMIFESYFVISRSYYPGFISVFIPPLFTIFNINILSRQVRDRRVELESLYNKLRMSKENEKDKEVSDTIKEKLKRVIEFIDENFNCDFSREGLAAAVDLHPNYMGSQFKIYTGETIHTYINQLRIREAIKKIESGDPKIIDIAFSVGYESLSTFHRVFKKITGKTPQEYKNDN